MSTKAKLETQITGDEAPFVKAVENAEKRAQTFSGRIEHLFRRTSSIRAERAVGGFTENLLQGNVSSAVQAVGSRLGLGLATGVGIAAGLGLAKAFENVEERLQKINEIKSKLLGPVSSGAFAPGEEFQGNLSGIADAIKVIDEQQKKSDPQSHTLEKLTGLITGQDFNAQRDDARMALRQHAIKDIDALAEGQKILNQAQAEENTGSAQQVAYLQEEARHRQTLYQLAKSESAVGVNNSAQRSEENENNRLKVDAIQKRFLLHQLEIDSESRIAQIQITGLDTEEKKTATLRERITLLQQQEKLEGDPQRKEQIQTKLTSAQDQSDRHDYAVERGQIPGPALYTPERGAEQAYQAWKRGNNSPAAYKTHPDAYKTHPDAYPSADQAGSHYRSPSFADHMSGFFPPRWLDPQETSAGQNLVSGLKMAQRNTAAPYGSLGTLYGGKAATSGISDWGIPENAISGFGKGSFMNAVPLAGSAAKTTAGGGGNATQADASDSKLVGEMIKAGFERLSTSFERIWGGQ